MGRRQEVKYATRPGRYPSTIPLTAAAKKRAFDISKSYTVLVGVVVDLFILEMLHDPPVLSNEMAEIPSKLIGLTVDYDIRNRLQWLLKNGSRYGSNRNLLSATILSEVHTTRVIEELKIKRTSLEWAHYIRGRYHERK